VYYILYWCFSIGLTQNPNYTPNPNFNHNVTEKEYNIHNILEMRGRAHAAVARQAHRTPHALYAGRQR